MIDLNTSQKVGFIIAGTQKAGTTALDAYLRQHPQICMANEKELHFFDVEQSVENARLDNSHYHSQFTPQSHHKLLGESTPIYMYWHAAPALIAKYNPDMKWIMVLRNPIERAFSHWNMERARGAETLSFWDAITTEKTRCREAHPYQHRVYSYVDRGFYVQQLENIWRYFSRQQSLVLKTEALKQNPTAVLDEICRFLGVDPMQKMKPMTAHAASYNTHMTEREWRYLQDIFEAEVLELERKLQWDCGDWLNR